MKRFIIPFVSVLLVCFISGCGGGSDDGRIKMGMMPKLIGIPYFNACEQGAKEAAAELGINLVYDGTTSDRVEDQVKMIDRWIAQGFDIIAVAGNDPEVIAPALKRAKDAGIVVLTWDADANIETSQRATFVNQAPTKEIGNAMVDMMAEATGGKGEHIIVTGSATAPNQNAWMKVMRQRISEKYPEMVVPEPLVPDEDQLKAQRMTTDAINAHPDLKGIWGITSVALPAAAKAVSDTGKREEIYVTGLSLPSKMRDFVKSGVVEKFVLWDPVDLGYLTVQVARRLAENNLNEGIHTMGRLKEIKVTPEEVILGPPLVFDENNVDDYQF